MTEQGDYPDEIEERYVGFVLIGMSFDVEHVVL